MLFHERDEIEQQLAGLLQLNPKLRRKSGIARTACSKRGHRAPPGHGKASVRNASRSTLA